MKAYKALYTQELRPDRDQRRIFAQLLVLEMHENEIEFHRKVILSWELTAEIMPFNNAPQSIEAFEDNFRYWWQTATNVWKKRAWSCKRHRGSQLSDFVFHDLGEPIHYQLE